MRGNASVVNDRDRPANSLNSRRLTLGLPIQAGVHPAITKICGYRFVLGHGKEIAVWMPKP